MRLDISKSEKLNSNKHGIPCAYGSQKAVMNLMMLARTSCITTITTSTPNTSLL